MATKRERIIQLFKDKPEDYRITDIAWATQYLIDSGFISTLTTEELSEEPNNPQDVWGCWVESQQSVTEPEQPPIEP